MNDKCVIVTCPVQPWQQDCLDKLISFLSAISMLEQDGLEIIVILEDLICFAMDREIIGDFLRGLNFKELAVASETPQTPGRLRLFLFREETHECFELSYQLHNLSKGGQG